MNERPPINPPATIGFVGIGNMGRPMAARLAQAGYRVRAFDVSQKAAAALAGMDGISIEASLADAANGAAAVVTMRPDGKAVEAASLGPAGIASRLAEGGILIDMSSSDPVGTRALGAKLAQRGIQLVDAPVSGGVKRALDGSLAAMVGGDAEAIGRARPAILAMASQIFATGPLGSGHAMKALNNLVSAAGLWVAAEALLIGKSFGLAEATMVDVLNASTGRNNSTENKFKQQILSRGFASGFSLGLMAKDLTTASDLAEATQSFAPYSRHCAELWREAAGELGSGADHTAVVKFLERRAGKTLES
jgi:3-hydroxyisobutyrate dehydrogenase